MMRWLTLLVVTLFVSAAHAEPSRLTGRINSITPAEGVMLVDEVGEEDLTAVDFRAAQVVRVWRSRFEPWRWLERSVRLAHWPAGTFVVVIGSVDPHGRVRADRIEIPRPDHP